MRIVRNVFVASLIAVLGVLAGAGSAGATGQAVRPADTFEGQYLTITMCQDAGNNGIAAGDWKSFHCIPARVGLDVWFSLYVTT